MIALICMEIMVCNSLNSKIQADKNSDFTKNHKNVLYVINLIMVCETVIFQRGKLYLKLLKK